MANNLIINTGKYIAIGWDRLHPINQAVLGGVAVATDYYISTIGREQDKLNPITLGAFFVGGAATVTLLNALKQRLIVPQDHQDILPPKIRHSLLRTKVRPF